MTGYCLIAHSLVRWNSLKNEYLSKSTPDEAQRQKNGWRQDEVEMRQILGSHNKEGGGSPQGFPHVERESSQHGIK